MYDRKVEGQECGQGERDYTSAFEVGGGQNKWFSSLIKPSNLT
jgi:hypothetical protein